MNDLLAFTLGAHGGLAAWRSFRKISATVDLGRTLWTKMRRPARRQVARVEARLHEQWLRIAPLTRHEPGTLFTGARGVSGPSLEVGDPSPWDLLHATFFHGHARWTELTSPFLYASSGFATEEIDLWHENGETWRRLMVTFPEHIVSHTRVQILYIGPDGLMRRHDYTVDVLGGAPGANYPANYASVQGLMLPRRRTVVAYGHDLRPVPSPVLAWVDYRAMRLE